MPLITTRALVLRETKYKEADKILTVLSETEGKLSVKAAGALRKGCKYAAATECLAYSELTLFCKNGRWSIKEALTLEQFLPLREDISSLALGVYFAELAEAVSDEDSPNPELLRLCLNALFALSRNMHEPRHIKAAFELRLMCLSGYEPALNRCGHCGGEPVTDISLDLNGGALYCKDCIAEKRREGLSVVMAPLCVGSLAAMRHIVSSETKRIFSFTLGDSGGAAKRLSTACESYALSQLDRSFGALEYWKSVK